MMDLPTFDPRHLAEQLTIYESQLFKQINPTDVLGRLGQLHELKHQLELGNEPSVAADDSLTPMIDASSRVTMWAAKGILSIDRIRGRAKAIEKVISLANECRRLQNHTTLQDLLAALNAPAVSRLMDTWSYVSSPKLELLLDLRDVLPPRFGIASYSAKVTLPCIPPLGLFLYNTADVEGEVRLYREFRRFQLVSYDHLTPDDGLLTRIRETLATVDPNEDLWALSGKQEALTREDMEMRELFIQAASRNIAAEMYS